MAVPEEPLFGGKPERLNKSPAYLPSHRGYDRYFGYYSGVMDYFTHAQVSLALGIPAASAICGVCWLHL